MYHFHPPFPSHYFLIPVFFPPRKGAYLCLFFVCVCVWSLSLIRIASMCTAGAYLEEYGYQVVAVHTLIPSTQETEASRFLWIWDHPSLQNESRTARAAQRSSVFKHKTNKKRKEKKEGRKRTSPSQVYPAAKLTSKNNHHNFPPALSPDSHRRYMPPFRTGCRWWSKVQNHFLHGCPWVVALPGKLSNYRLWHAGCSSGTHCIQGESLWWPGGPVSSHPSGNWTAGVPASPTSSPLPGHFHVLLRAGWLPQAWLLQPEDQSSRSPPEYVTSVPA